MFIRWKSVLYWFQNFQDFNDQPVLTISGVFGGSAQTLSVALPLFITKFNASAPMDQARFFERWRGLSQPEQETQAIFTASSPINKESGTYFKWLVNLIYFELFCWTESVLFTNKNYISASQLLSSCGLTVLSGVDPKAENHVAASIIHTQQTIGVLLRLEPNIQVCSSKDFKILPIYNIQGGVTYL